MVDLGGARGVGVTPGLLTVVVDGVEVDVDLSDASTIEDVRAGLEAAMQTVDPGATVSLDAAAGDGFVVTPSAGVSIEIQDTGSGTVAADLGLSEISDRSSPHFAVRRLCLFQYICFMLHYQNIIVL